MSRKDKLLGRLCERPRDFSWSDTCTLMKQCDFKLYMREGSRRLFRHAVSKQKVIMHEPHPEPVLKQYQIDDLIQALKDAGEIAK
jgi:hypothetical protein